MTYRIIAFDPGGSTGWATYTAENMWHDGVTEYYKEKFACGTLGPNKEEHHVELELLLENQRVSTYTVVCESFEFRQHDNHRQNVELISREYIGVIKLFCRREGIPLTMQTAAQAKGFIPDKGPQANKKIKEAGLWHPNSVHAMDATRHLLYNLVNKRGRLDLVEKWWKPKQ